MDTNNNGQAPATDDQELAQVLAGMNQQAVDQPVPDTTADGMQFEETGDTPSVLPETPTDAPSADTTDASQAAEPVAEDPSEPAAPVEPTITPPIAPLPEPLAVPTPDTATPPVASPELESIKKDALEQLRPLVDKLDLPAQEKFDTLLLIIRSTDDQSLVGAANEAAKAIEDETKRAEALLDVIKEIDFFSHPAQ